MHFPKAILGLLFTASLTSCYPSENFWSQLGRMAGFLLQKCMTLETDVDDVGKCLRRRTLIALERTSRLDVIQLMDGIALVRYKNDAEDAMRERRTMVLPNGKEPNWTTEVIKKLRQIFRTHVLKVSLSRLNNTISFEGRGRRKGNMMAQLLMFGMLAAGLIVIPMGFQFLAVLGGKALLLAKLALLLTSIQGLKKIATSQYGYGLYATGQGPCKDAPGYPAGCGMAGLGLDAGRYRLRIDVEDESWAEWLQGHYDRQWPYEGDAQASNTYTVQHERPDLLHPSEYINIHPRQEQYSAN